MCRPKIVRHIEIKKKYKSRDIYSAKKLKMELKDQPYEKKILQL